MTPRWRFAPISGKFRAAPMRAPALLALAAVATLFVALACSNQGEGEVCDINNGNNDCQSNLVCARAPGVNEQSTPNVFRCCPPEGQPGTVPACQVPLGFDAGMVPPDAEGEVEAGPDATVPDAGPEAASEASTDAGGTDGANGDASDGSPE
jgi:hypothetical protein